MPCLLFLSLSLRMCLSVQQEMIYILLKKEEGDLLDLSFFKRLIPKLINGGPDFKTYPLTVLLKCQIRI